MVSTNVRKQRTRRALGLLLLFGLIAVLIVASIAIGTRSMSLGTLLHPDQITAAIIRDLRIPRTMLGVLVGAALGVSGTLIQGHTRNPLADPGVLGISSGAACAVVVGFTFFGITSIVGTVVVAFTGAILATLLVFFAYLYRLGSDESIECVAGWCGTVGGAEFDDQRFGAH